MSAGSSYMWLWQDNEKYKKPTEVSAPTYIKLTLDWCEKLMNDPQIFSQNGIKYICLSKTK